MSKSWGKSSIGFLNCIERSMEEVREEIFSYIKELDDKAIILIVVYVEVLLSFWEG
jgi:hypothetical protein|nr:hypothetical protein [uncultured Porphyromonas sp.]